MKKIRLVSIVLALGLVCGLALPASAGGLTVFGGKIDAQVIPGQEYSYTMKVQNTSDGSLDIAAESKGYGTTPDSPFSVLEPEADKSDYSAREMLTISPAAFHLEPNESREVTVQAKIPSQIGDGGRYAIVYIHTVPKGGTVATISGMAARVLLTMQGSRLIHDSQIASVDFNSQSLETRVTVTHTGNHHFKPHLHGKLMQGDKVFATALTRDDWPMIPNYSRQLALNFIAGEKLAPDEFQAVIEVHDEFENVVAQHTAAIKIGTPYTPPPTIPSPTPGKVAFQPVSVAINPSSAAILKTEDNRISISIPQGAVTSPTQFSLESYSPEQISAMSSGSKPAMTCFKVVGLNGLLAKEATLTVRYSAADLEKAEGAADRLALARWDAADNRWTVLDTQVDKQKTTLTVDTIQFSIWTVVVLPTPSVEWWLLGIITVGIVLAISWGLFLVIKRKSLFSGRRI